jgi:hypothetical protein
MPRHPRIGLAALVGLLAIPLAAGCGAAISTNSSSNSATTTAGTPTAAPVLGNSRMHPVPLGQTADVDGWTVKVISVAPEKTDSIDGAPPTGTSFEVFTLQVTNTASTPAAPSLSLISDLVGSDNVAYSVDSDPMCYGGSPDNDNVYQHGTVEFGACISVPSEVTGLLLNVSGFISDSSTWFVAQ